MNMNTNATEPRLRVDATADIGAPAGDVYRMIADYHEGHTRIIPPRYFRNLRVERGGYGAGTDITFDMTVLGKTHHTRGHVTEPEPGRVLVETYPETNTETTFVVEPLGSTRSRVTIATTLPARPGVRGWLERAFTTSFLRRVYAAELAQLDEQVRFDRADRESVSVR